MTSTPPLLTIIVPTFNRADNLQLLLGTLKQELSTVQLSVSVLVSDNASTDRTASMLAEIQAGWPELVVQRQVQNLGPDGNFCSCVDRVESRYFWIIGDDDLPKRGVLSKVVKLLAEETPALVYMESDWVPRITGPDQGRPVEALQVDMLDAAWFASRVHIWLTFISGVVVDRPLLLRTIGAHTIRRFTGTSLVQLGWILPLLKAEGRFAFINNACVLATRDNSGGYPVLTVFGLRFARIVHDVLGRDDHMARALVDGNIRRYLPTPAWQARRGPKPGFEAEDPWPALRGELSDSPWFWLLIFPVARFPRLLAYPYYQCWRILNRLGKELHKARTHLGSRIDARQLRDGAR